MNKAFLYLTKKLDYSHVIVRFIYHIANTDLAEIKNGVTPIT